MDRIVIRGGSKLEGSIPISGAKNAALPLMIASLLTDQTLTLENLPRLADVNQLIRILGNQGVDFSVDGKRPGEDAMAGQTAHLRAKTIVDTTAPYELVSRMRASFWVIAPLLARMGEARVSLPGGCAIGTRPVDLLLMALEKLGAWQAAEPKFAMAESVRAALTLVARGEAEIGFQQVAELIHTPGVDFVGTVPAEIQPPTYFVGLLTTNAREPEAAATLLRFLSSEQAATVITKNGLKPLAAH